MKLRIPTRAARQVANQDAFKWQVFFCLIPRRLDEFTVIWMERASRRKMTSIKYARLGPILFARNTYVYGPITNALMQPGVYKDVESAAAQQPGLFNPAAGQVFIPSLWSRSISGAQAGNLAVQGGLVSPLGQGRQVFPISGAANAGPPAQGGYNPPPPQP